MFRVGQEIKLLDYDTIVKKYGIRNKLNIKSSRFSRIISCAPILFGIDFDKFLGQKFKIEEIHSDDTVYVRCNNNNSRYYIPFEFIKTVTCLDEKLFIL